MTHDPSIVMIVDDDDSIRRAVRRLMKSFGIAVETFASAEEFLGSERLGKTSLLNLGGHIPRMDGLQLQQRLVASHHAIPIIFITGFGDAARRRGAVKGGA